MQQLVAQSLSGTPINEVLLMRLEQYLVLKGNIPTRAYMSRLPVLIAAGSLVRTDILCLILHCSCRHYQVV